MKFFDCYSVRDCKSSAIKRKDYFYTSLYNVNLDPQDERNNKKDGLVPINKI